MNTSLFVKSAAILAFVFLVLPLRAAEIVMTMVGTGVEIDVPEVGNFIVEVPLLTSSDGRAERGSFEVLSATEGVAKYPSGAEVNVQLAGSEITYQYPSGDYKGLTFNMTVPKEPGKSGKFALGDDALKDFPSQFAGQFADKGNGKSRLSVVNSMDEGLTVSTAANWSALQDNRAFGTSSFSFQWVYDFKAHFGKDSLSISVSPYKAP